MISFFENTKQFGADSLPFAICCIIRLAKICSYGKASRALFEKTRPASLRWVPKLSNGVLFKAV